MATITISKKEYQELVDKAFRYDYIRQLMREGLFDSPPVRKTRDVVESFEKMGLYNKKFLERLEAGLKRSSYFQV